MNATRLQESRPDIWHVEHLRDGVVVARARVEVDYEGQPTLTRLLTFEHDATFALRLVDACLHHWPTLVWLPRICKGDGTTFEQFVFLKQPNDETLIVVGVLDSGVMVTMGHHELTNRQIEWLAKYPEDYGPILGVKV